VYRGVDGSDTTTIETSLGFKVSDGDFFSQSTYTLTLDVFAAAAAPTLNVHDATGEINTPVPLGIAAGLVDTDGSERLSVTVDGVPTGVSLSAGTELNDTWYLNAADLDGLTLTGSVPRSFTLQVTATSVESTTADSASTMGQFNVRLDGPGIQSIAVPTTG